MVERLTEKTIGCFEYALKDHKPVVGEFSTYEAFYDYSTAVKRLGQYEDTGLTPEDIKSLYHDAGLSLAIRSRDLEAENKGLRAKLTEWEASCDTRDKMLVDYAAQLAEAGERVRAMEAVVEAAKEAVNAIFSTWEHPPHPNNPVTKLNRAIKAYKGVKGQ